VLESLTGAVSGSPLTYLVVAALVAGDAVVPLFPGESSVVAAAVLAADGELNVLLVALAAFAGAFAGDLAMYAVGRYAGPRLIRRYAREGRRAERVTWARRQVDRRGAALIVAAQFIPGGRNVVMLGAGSLRYPLPRFLAAEAAGAAAWAVFQTTIGYVGGSLLDDTLVALGVSVAVAIAAGAAIEGADRLRRRGASRRDGGGVAAGPAGTGRDH
jgi:membrane protein DedA with SNARE-associated domain